MNGILLVNKPSGPTSFNVIRRIKSAVKLKAKIGHTGTLDPMASGLMVICIGQATRIAQFLVGLDKEYIGEMTLGIKTDSFDATGVTIEENSDIQPSLDDILEHIPHFSGEIEQTPPVFSAIKQEGVRLYEFAHKGKSPEHIKSRKVNVYSFEVLEYMYPFLRFKAVVSSGTYIRSLANDIGEAVGCGAHLSALERTRVGNLFLSDAFFLDDLYLAEDPFAFFKDNLYSIQYALRDMPKIHISEKEEEIIDNISKGLPFTVPAIDTLKRLNYSPGQTINVLALEEKLVDEEDLIQQELAVCQIQSTNETFYELKPKIVFKDNQKM